MSIEEDFRTRALSTAVTAIVGQKVALNAAPQGSELPLIVYSVSHQPDYTLNGTLIADDAVIEVQCWAESAVQSLASADALSSAVSHAEAVSACTEIGRATAYDTENDLHAVVLTFQWLT